MVTITRFGKKLKLPATVEIKHQLLLRWLADQTAQETAQDTASQAAAATLTAEAGQLSRRTT